MDSSYFIIFVLFLNVPLLTYQDVLPKKKINENEDFLYYKGNQIAIEENNFTAHICSCEEIHFHLVLAKHVSKHYGFQSKNSDCDHYQVMSSNDKVEILQNMMVVAEARGSLEKIVLKCYSNDTSWKILKECWIGSEIQKCWVICPHRHCTENKEKLNGEQDFSTENNKTTLPPSQQRNMTSLEDQHSPTFASMTDAVIIILVVLLPITAAMLYCVWEYVRRRQQLPQGKSRSQESLAYERIVT